jgi:hypothetical protein
MLDFMHQFSFDPQHAWLVGLEREALLVDGQGTPVPYAKDALEAVGDDSRFGCELSACQVEMNVGPDTLDRMPYRIDKAEKDLAAAAASITFSRSMEVIPAWTFNSDKRELMPFSDHVRLSHSEVAPHDMPLDVYPDASGRYQQIAERMPEDVLRAACQALGTHIHVGMPDPDTALRVYNFVVQFVWELSELGNGSFGDRLQAYRTVAPDAEPHQYKDWAQFYQAACENGFAQNPRDCWDLIRISKHGTIEFRMFGATSSVDRIMEWGQRCYELCLQAVR